MITSLRINDSCIGISLIQDSRLSLCVDIISAEPKNLGVMYLPYLLYMGEKTTEESSTDITGIDISGIHNHITPL